jgi:molybdopterin-guanine dinucleotide biosynthesis protein A
MSGQDVTAIVLAGGRSSRFGRDKLVEPFAGQTLLERAVAGVAPLARETIVVVAPDESRGVPPGVIRVSDPTSFEGPLVGLLTGLRSADDPVVVVAGGDMPTMTPSVLAILVQCLDDPGVHAAVLDDQGRARPLPGALRTAPATAAAERLVAAGERRLLAIYDALPTTVVDEATWRALDPDGRTLRDIDTPADLR